jgi:hypothetical protein
MHYRPAYYNDSIPGLDADPDNDTCWVTITPRSANFRGRNGAHIITGKNSGFNFPATGYYTYHYATGSPACNTAGAFAVNPLKVPRQGLSNTHVGLYTPQIGALGNYWKVEVRAWVKVDGRRDQDYGELRYALLEPTDPRLLDNSLNNSSEGASASFPVNGVWHTLPLDSAYRMNGTAKVPYTGLPAGETQLVNLDQWTEVVWKLPDSIGLNPNLRLGFFWRNEEDSTYNATANQSQALTIDEVMVRGIPYRFRTNQPSNAVYCPGSRIEVPYEILVGNFTPASDYELLIEISDNTGAFPTVNPVFIDGSISDFAPSGTPGTVFSGTLRGFIPVNLPAGSGYRVRAVIRRKGSATEQYVASTNSTPFSIQTGNGISNRLTLSYEVEGRVPNTVLQASGTVRICAGETVTLQVARADVSSVIYWYTGGSIPRILTQFGQATTIRLTEPGNYWVETRGVLGQCDFRTPVLTLEVATPSEVSLPAVRTTFCYGEVAVLPSFFTNIPANYTLVNFEGEGLRFDSAASAFVFNTYRAGVGTHPVMFEFEDATGTTPCGFQFFSAVAVTVNPSPISRLSHEDTLYLCAGETFTLGTVLAGGNVRPEWKGDVIWSTGEVRDQISISRSGEYFAEVRFEPTFAGEAGCSAYTDTLTVIVLPGELDVDLRFAPVPGVQAPTVTGEFNVAPLQSYRSIIDSVIVQLWVNGRFTQSVAAQVGQELGTFTMPLIRRLQGGERVQLRGYIRTRTDAGGCRIALDQSAESVLLTLQASIPTGFSPTSAIPENQAFRIPNLENFSRNSLEIFNRWGAVVYPRQSYDNNNPWTARDHPDGQYYYILEVELPTGEVQKFKGSFTVLR